jgi:ATP-binding cassette, subfamily B (MDR/TAP), member 1
MQLITLFSDAIKKTGTVKPEDITAGDINNVVYWFIVLGCITLVASFFEVAMFMWSGTRQVARLRQRYLEASLNQEQAYYDTQATSGNVLSGLNEDCQAVQNAISEKVGNVIHHVGTFISAIVIALVTGWKLALVMMALMPLIAIAGAAIAKVLTSGAVVLSKGYSDANVASSQAITNIRTIASFQAEETSFEKYRELLDYPRKVQTKVSTIGGLSFGVVNCVIFFTCGAAPAAARLLLHLPWHDLRACERSYGCSRGTRCLCHVALAACL